MRINMTEQSYLENCSHYYDIFRQEMDPSAQVHHRHDYYQVCFVSQGSIIHKHEDASVTLHRGDCFIIPPTFTHSMESLTDDTVCCFLSFQESLFYPDHQSSNAYQFFAALSLDTMNANPTDVRLKVSLPQQDAQCFQSLFDCLLYEHSLNLERQNTNADSLITAMVTIIARNYFDEPVMHSKLHEINEYNQIMLECQKYIDEHYMDPLTVTQLSRRFAVSTSTFGVMFPRVVGLPFKQYLNRKRISSAAALCAVESLTLQEIAIMCGYSDSSTFYRNFIKYMGVSPSAYRERQFGEPANNSEDI